MVGWLALPNRLCLVPKRRLVAALALRLFGVLLALLVAAATTTTLIASGLSAALVELLDAAGRTAWSSRTARSASAKVLLLALATAALFILVAVALLELVGTTRSTWLAEGLLLARAAATLVEIIAVALLELIGASGSDRRTKVLLLALAAATLIVLAVALLEPIGSALTTKVLLLVEAVCVLVDGCALFADDFFDWRDLATFRLPLVASAPIALFAIALLELIGSTLTRRSPSWLSLSRLSRSNRDRASS